MMRIIGIIVAAFLTSCCGTHTEIDYSYIGTTITRVDECGRTSFYYQNEDNGDKGRIWCEYSGINDGFAGYLRFSSNGKVEILVGDGYFQSENVDTVTFQYKRIYAYERPTQDKSVYEILLSTRYEQERNKKADSDVKAVYRVDDNDWW